MKETNPVLLCFYRPVQWWGWVIAYYQLLRGVKYWQLVHCEIMTEEGQYAYRINEVVHGSYDVSIPNPSVAVTISYPGFTSKNSRRTASRFTYRLWGDFSPLSLINGNHCVRYCKVMLGLRNKTNLPGQLYYELENV